MPVITDLIRTEADGSISFGNYELKAKTKKSDFEFEGDLYKIKTFNELTRLEKNELFLYESEPGTAVTHMKETAEGMSFTAWGPEDAQITIQCEPETDYDILIDGEIRDVQKSNLGGKLSFSVKLGDGSAKVQVLRNFPRVLSGEKTSRMYKLFLNSSLGTARLSDEEIGKPDKQDV